MQKETETPLILTVDDDAVVVNFIERLLRREGFRVIKASDGVDAVSQVRDNNPDLILLDINMPGPDGILTLERIREISKAPVIMLTGLDNDKYLKASFDKGADDFINKPFRPADLITRINAILNRT